ncbi:hypothetical protein ACG2DA_22310, partial [Alienimonas sp. DA493]
RDEVPRLEAVPPQQMVRQAPAAAAPVASRSIPVSAEVEVGRVTVASPAAASRPQPRYVAPRTVQAAPAEPTLVRAPAPPASATADDLEFFPEQSEAEADGRFVPPRQVAVQEPTAEPETPSLAPLPAPPQPAPARPVRSEPVRVAAAPTPRPAAPAAVREAPTPVEEPAAEDDGTPFTGLSLAATEPEFFEEPPAPAAAPEVATEPERRVGAPTAEDGFDLAQSPGEEEEAGWDLTVAAKAPAAAAPAPVEEAAVPEASAEPEASTTVAAAPAQAPTAAADAPAAPKSQPTAPGRPDPTKLLEKLAARADRSLLMGFCPVTLRDERDLAEGDDRFTAEFEGVTYRFASAEARVKFVADPARYAPAAGGRDLVIASTGWGETVGSLAHAAWYKGRLYLFASRESMRRFVANPRDYLDG